MTHNINTYTHFFYSCIVEFNDKKKKEKILSSFKLKLKINLIIAK